MKFNNRLRLLIILICGLAFCTGCHGKEKISLEPAENQYKEIAETSSDDRDADYGIPLQINETIMEHFTFNAELSIPVDRLKTYVGTYNSYDLDAIISLLWGDTAQENIIVTYQDGGSVSAEYGDESFAYTDLLGAFSYCSSEKADYMATLFTYALEDSLLSNPELKFLSKKEAGEDAAILLEQLGISNEGTPVVYSASKEELLSLQARMQNDEEYQDLFEINKLFPHEFSEDDAAYYVVYSFTKDGFPIYGKNDPAMMMSGGMDSPNIAQQMEASLIITENGIQMIHIFGAVAAEMDETSEQCSIGYEDIKEALIKEFGDVILTEDYNLTDIWLEYVPLVDMRDGQKVTITPVWCSEIYIADYGAPMSIRINAVTGELVS